MKLANCAMSCSKSVWLLSCHLTTVCPQSSDPFYVVTNYRKLVNTSWTLTVCPGSSDPPEKLLKIFASENVVFTIF